MTISTKIRLEYTEPNPLWIYANAVSDAFLPRKKLRFARSEDSLARSVLHSS